MRLALVQTNPTVGDLDGNRTLIRQSAQDAAAQGAELAVFCELTITGYPPRDLLDRPAGQLRGALTAYHCGCR